MSTLNSGPWQHNRFSGIDALYEQERRYYTELAEKKKAKKDYDGDGEVESSSKEHAGVVHNAIQKKKGGVPDGKDTRKDVKEGKCAPDCKCEACSDKKAKKKAMYEWIEELVQEGYDLSEYTMEDMEILFDQALAESCEEETEEFTIEEAICQYLIDNGFANNPVSAEVVYANMSEDWRDDVVNQIHEIYKGKHGQSEKEYQDGRSNAGKMISGDSKLSGAAYSARGVKNTGPNPAGGSQKPKAQGRMGSKDRAYLQYRKANFKKG